MYIFSIGSNDIMEYLFSPLKTMTPKQFVINLTDAYAIHLKVPFTSKLLRITTVICNHIWEIIYAGVST
ncbi:hypothetical protein Hanom_Chr07g00636951 [Helianthus anomalus]